MKNKNKKEVSILNRKARYEYIIKDEFDAGLVLLGSEVKSIRNGDVNINDSFVYVDDGEVWIKNMKISKYKHAYPENNHQEDRLKKLLLTKSEISKIKSKLSDRGTTCVPLKLYSNSNRIKIKIAIAKGKKNWDKRESIKERDLSRDSKYF